MSYSRKSTVAIFPSLNPKFALPFLFRSPTAQLPYDIWGPASVQYEDSLLLVGGYSYDSLDYPDTVLKFDVETEAWIPMNGTLAMGRSLLGTALVADSIVDCV